MPIRSPPFADGNDDCRPLTVDCRPSAPPPAFDDFLLAVDRIRRSSDGLSLAAACGLLFSVTSGFRAPPPRLCRRVGPRIGSGAATSSFIRSLVDSVMVDVVEDSSASWSTSRRRRLLMPATRRASNSSSSSSNPSAARPMMRARLRPAESCSAGTTTDTEHHCTTQ